MIDIKSSDALDTKAPSTVEEPSIESHEVRQGQVDEVVYDASSDSNIHTRSNELIRLPIYGNDDIARQMSSAKKQSLVRNSKVHSVDQGSSTLYQPEKEYFETMQSSYHDAATNLTLSQDLRRQSQ